MKQIFKDVLSCKSLRDGVKQALTAILIAVLERIIVSLRGEQRIVGDGSPVPEYYIDS